MKGDERKKKASLRIEEDEKVCCFRMGGAKSFVFLMKQFSCCASPCNCSQEWIMISSKMHLEDIEGSGRSHLTARQHNGMICSYIG